MKSIVFIAPPSAGKGTQSSMLAEKYDYKHISTGELLREEINTGSELGQTIKNIIDNGSLVSDELINELLTKELKDNNQLFILDGYPRNISQAERLSTLFNDDYLVIYLEIDKDEAMKRALGRIVCPSCKAGYNTCYDKLKPKVEGICDKCGHQLIKRVDDTEETFNKRFEEYLTNTKPLLEYYEKLNKLYCVKVMNEKIDTFNIVESVINNDFN